jgi:glutamine synthetase
VSIWEDNLSLSRDDILRIIKEEKIRYIHLWFADINGRLRGLTIPESELPDAFDRGVGFDGSSIEGFARIEESDLLAVPDMNTFALLPNRIGEGRAARFICDLKTPEGAPFEGDTRYVLKRTLEKYATENYIFYFGPEVEYFYFANETTPVPVDLAGYFDDSVVDLGTQVRQQTADALMEMGIPIEVIHHEVAPSQHEIDLVYADALTMADRCLTCRFLVRAVARQLNLHASFMPKPVSGQNGTGMHTHQSVFQGNRNLFFDPIDSYHLSRFARSYMTGILKNIRAMTAVLNQTVNSYKRLVVGYEAPVYITWGQKNRSALIRVPRYRLGDEKATRIELRSPDPTCNPYLAFSVMIAAGMDGVQKKLAPPPPIEENIYEMRMEALNDHGIEMLPGSLHEAIGETEKSELVAKTLGEHVFRRFIANKKVEWNSYRTAVTDYEIREYYPIY